MNSLAESVKEITVAKSKFAEIEKKLTNVHTDAMKARNEYVAELKEHAHMYEACMRELCDAFGEERKKLDEAQLTQATKSIQQCQNQWKEEYVSVLGEIAQLGEECQCLVLSVLPDLNEKARLAVVAHEENYNGCEHEKKRIGEEEILTKTLKQELDSGSALVQAKTKQLHALKGAPLLERVEQLKQEYIAELLDAHLDGKKQLVQEKQDEIARLGEALRLQAEKIESEKQQTQAIEKKLGEEFAQWQLALKQQATLEALVQAHVIDNWLVNASTCWNSEKIPAIPAPVQEFEVVKSFCCSLTNEFKNQEEVASKEFNSSMWKMEKAILEETESLKKQIEQYL